MYFSCPNSSWRGSYGPWVRLRVEGRRRLRGLSSTAAGAAARIRIRGEALGTENRISLRVLDEGGTEQELHAFYQEGKNSTRSSSFPASKTCVTDPSLPPGQYTLQLRSESSPWQSYAVTIEGGRTTDLFPEDG